MMPLQGMFKRWRTLGVPEKGLVVGGAPIVGAEYGAPDEGFSIGYDAPEERGCYGGEP
jgi:hypothetical protein